MKYLYVIWCLLILSFIYPLKGQAQSLDANLQWANPVDITDSIQVEKSTSLTGSFALLKQLAPNTITYTDSTNSQGTTGCYRVAYFNTSGVGPYVGPVCKTFPQTPQTAPSSLTVK